MKYNLGLRRYWWGWFKRDLKKLYYSKIHKFNMDGFGGTMIPSTGKGKYVSVYTKGQIIQIVNEPGNEKLGCFHNEIRIIPCKDNHGVMIEQIKDGKMLNRNHLDIAQLNKNIIFASNVEQLTKRHND